MQELLAEKLLAKVMDWQPSDIARERPILQTIARLKYDEYQQFSPGMRFTESLALWLKQFDSKHEKKTAYNFIREKLLFFSTTEMIHFVSILYPDKILPKLYKETSQLTKIPSYKIRKLYLSNEFKELQRRSLFLGLSDGARIDIFRRSNQSQLNNEQIFQTHELTEDRVENMSKELLADLKTIRDSDVDEKDCYFKNVYLIDDFSGSGITYIRKDDGSKKYKGKIAIFLNKIINSTNGLSELFNKNDLKIYICLYVITKKARMHLNKNLDYLLDSYDNIKFEIISSQELTDSSVIDATKEVEFIKIINKYYDPKLEDKHTKKGGSDLRMGFNDCGLPLVLSHNTPNNSIFLLWSYSEIVKGLFPRVSRHKGENV